MAELANILCCKIGNLSMNYFGMSLVGILQSKNGLELNSRKKWIANY